MGKIEADPRGGKEVEHEGFGELDLPYVFF
jgi:hypothetical protein